MNATDLYIQRLIGLKHGDLGLLRAHAGQILDESVDGFDLFSGLWWPLRQNNQRAPRREVAWLIAKLYAHRPVPPFPGDTLPYQLARCQPMEVRVRKRFRQKFDEMLALTIELIEPALSWALDEIGSNNLKLDWTQLTDDLSIWERESTRLRWAEQFLQAKERGLSC